MSVAKPRRVLLLVVALSVVVATCKASTKNPAPNLPAAIPAVATGGGELVVVPTDTNPHELKVTITVPDGASEMQVGADPTFTTVPWQPVAASASVVIADNGYQTVFARFRDHDGHAVGHAMTGGVSIDDTAAAATASAGGKPHRASTIGLVAPDVLAVMVESGRVQRGQSLPYDFAHPQEGDALLDAGNGTSWVTRGGQHLGAQVAANPALLRTWDAVIGTPFDTAGLDDAGGYVVTSTQDAAFKGDVHPLSVSRIRRPTNVATTPNGQVMTTSDEIFLKLSAPLRSGSHYAVRFPNGTVEEASLDFDAKVTPSAAIHINEVGIHPDDPLKVAYLSAYTGAAGGIGYGSAPHFVVVNNADGSTVLDGIGSRRAVPADGELHKGRDLTGAPVYDLDFSKLVTAGTYRICVDEIGCSATITVDDHAGWFRTAVDLARSMYHERSGTALTPEYTSVVRPRGYFPGDGKLVVHQSKVSLLDVGGPSGEERFKMLKDGTTDDIVVEAWGGHFDAGDWDRNILSLAYLRSTLDLVELFPDTFAKLDLNIPESGDAVPDLIDEGLWDLELYRRLQLPDGGIRGGIEAADHPLDGEMSWTDTQEVWAYAPDARASYQYAASAAQAAQVLARYDRARADTYAASAKRAWDWAAAQPVADAHKEEVSTQRLMAAAALYRLTGEDAYQTVFVNEGPLVNGLVDLLACHDTGICDAVWYYARTNQPNQRADVRQLAIDSLRTNAENLAQLSDTTAFGWTLEHPYVPLIWGLGPSAPKAFGLLRGYVVAPEDKVLAAAIRSNSFSLGANPLDTVMMTGLGHTNVHNPLIVDTINGGIPVWPGTPVYGVHTLGNAEEWITHWFLKPAGTTPSFDQVPYLWSWADLPNIAPFTEFTIHQTHATALFTFGVLAGLAARHYGPAPLTSDDPVPPTTSASTTTSSSDDVATTVPATSTTTVDGSAVTQASTTTSPAVASDVTPTSTATTTTSVGERPAASTTTSVPGSPNG